MFAGQMTVKQTGTGPNNAATHPLHSPRQRRPTLADIPTAWRSWLIHCGSGLKHVTVTLTESELLSARWRLRNLTLCPCPPGWPAPQQGAPCCYAALPWPHPAASATGQPTRSEGTRQGGVYVCVYVCHVHTYTLARKRPDCILS
jgi:hypothetical protein